MSVYSHRFLIGNGDGVSFQWTCPTGYRAVVRSLCIASWISAGGACNISVNGMPLYMRQFTGVYVADSIDMRHVLYPGDVLACFTQGSGVSCFVSGYLFDDVTGTTQAPGEVVRIERPFGDQLPTGLSEHAG